MFYHQEYPVTCNRADVRPAFILLCVLFALSLVFAGQVPMFLGSNLGCWGMNGDGTLNESFVQSTTQRTLAKGVIGCMRFPCRDAADNGLGSTTITNASILDLVNKIIATGAQPLAILPSMNDARDVELVNYLQGKVTYYEFGNEDNWFAGWNGHTYATHWKSAIPKIRAAVQGIKIGGPTVSHVDANAASSNSKYLLDFLSDIAGQPALYPDFISFHIYNAHGENETSDWIMNNVAEWNNRVEWVRQQVIAKLGVDLPLACTEWNWDAAPESHGDNRDMDAQFMHDYTWAVLDVWKNHNVFMSCEYGYGSSMGGGHLTMMDWAGTIKPQYTAFKDYVTSGRAGTVPTQVAIPQMVPRQGAPAASQVYVRTIDIRGRAINKSPAAKGIYFVQSRCGKSVQTQKLIVGY
jgi:hypothetical protein